MFETWEATMKPTHVVFLGLFKKERLIFSYVNLRWRAQDAVSIP